MGIYLAAGKSTRFGANKLLASFKNKPLGSFALEAAIRSQMDHLIIVTKPDDELTWMTKHLKMSKRRWMQKKCIDSFRGMSYSLKCGVTVAEELGADAIVVLLADQPLVTSMIIDNLIDNFYENPDKYFIGTDELICPPILISAILFSELHNLEGDRGATQIIQKKKKNGLFLTKDSRHSKLLIDIDTKADLDNLKQM